MFEDSLVEARVRAADRQSGWLMLGSLMWQVALVAGLLLLPLLRPEGLVARAWTVRGAPSLRVPPKALPVRVSDTSAVASATRSEPRLAESASPRIRTEAAEASPEPVLAMLPTEFGDDAGGREVLSRLTEGVGSQRGVAVAADARGAAARRALPVSSGVAAGLLLMPIRPVYPPIAAHAGVQGVVVIEAVIAPSGAIESAHVVSGPALLREAAIEAVLSARYQPYRLNGEPIAVQTTVSIHFNLGGGS